MYLIFKQDTTVEVSSNLANTTFIPSWRQVPRGSIFELISQEAEIGCYTFVFKRLNNSAMCYTLTLDTKDHPFILTNDIEAAKVLYGSNNSK